MGVSTDAILFYGYCWEDEADIFDGVPDVEEGEWVTAIAKRRGIPNPWDQYSEPSRSLLYAEQRALSDKWIAEHRADLDTWHATRKAIEAEFGVAPDHHCHNDHGIPYLAAKEIRVRRGDREEITPHHMTVDPTLNAKLDRFLAEFGIEKPHESPRWWLVSYWG